MDSAKLTEPIQIYQLVETRTPSGAMDRDYEYKCSTSAFVRYASGNRTIDNEQIFYSVDRQFIVRHYVPVVETDEIRWNNQRWRILSIDRNKEFHNIQINTTLQND